MMPCYARVDGPGQGGFGYGSSVLADVVLLEIIVQTPERHCRSADRIWSPASPSITRPLHGANSYHHECHILSRARGAAVPLPQLGVLSTALKPIAQTDRRPRPWRPKRLLSASNGR